MKPSVGLSEETLKKSIALLSILLADVVLLSIKTQNLYWDASSESVMEHHKLFQTQYTELEETIDKVAERIIKLGGKSLGSMKEFLEITRLKEHFDKYDTPRDRLLDLLKDHQLLAVEIGKDIEQSNKNQDADTTEFLTKIMQQHVSIASILERYLI